MSYKFTFAVSPRPCKICTFLAFSFFFLLVISPSNCWAGKKVKLKDVQVLTLRQGEYTTGRRSSPVPQLQCLGGSAGCGNAPSVVQCYNRGSDGHSTQWECKADMSKSQKFGAIEVTCEGYNYPEDEYILAGSCGLEYRLERTGYGGGPTYVHSPYYSSSKSGSFFQNILFLGGAAFVIYVIYRSCLAPPGPDGDPPPYGDDRPPDYPGSPRGGFFGGGGGGGGMPPPPGFRPGYQTDASCGTARGYGYGSAGGGAGLGGGGFWTGAATGGLLGYMFGSRNNPGYQTAYGYPREGTFASSSSFGGSSSSSDTHTSSGFGGTRRR